MIKVLQEYVENFRRFRAESRRIDEEIDREGIYKYIEKHYGFDDRQQSVLRRKHA